MSERRLIGIDLAWSKGKRDKPNASGCAELMWADGELRLTRLDLRYSIDKIVEWIEPDRGHWLVAVDAPLVVCNEEGRREAEIQVSDAYRRYDAGAHSTNRKSGKERRGEQLRCKLEEHGGKLLEKAGGIRENKLVLETYPHPATVELFDLNLIIKYKMRDGMLKAQRRDRQQELADQIRTHFCDRPSAPRSGLNTPRLRRDDCLKALLSEPDPKATRENLKEREDKLDGLICAYIAAWADAGRCLQRFGVREEGVMFIPCLRNCTGVSLR